MMAETRTRKRDIIKQKLRKLTDKQILADIRDTLDKSFEVFKVKLGKYGLDGYKAAGGIGILTRITEKYYRMDNLLRTSEESDVPAIRDTIQDLSVYSTTLLAMIDKELVDVDEIRDQYKMIYGEIPHEEDED